MNEKEILDYNRRCAEFLGCEKYHSKMYNFETNVVYIIPQLKEQKYENCLLFHTDWNWIMEVYDKIQQLPSLGDINYPKTGPLGIFTNIKYHIPNKEKTVYAINQFLIWYEQNKLA